MASINGNLHSCIVCMLFVLQLDKFRIIERQYNGYVDVGSDKELVLQVLLGLGYHLSDETTGVIPARRVFVATSPDVKMYEKSMFRVPR